MAAVDSKILYETAIWGEEGKRTIQKYIKGCLFNHNVEVVSSATLLDLQTIPPPVYFKASLDVATLIQPHIIKHLVKEGTLIALSLGTLIDRDNVIALLPNGILKLLLQKEAYERLGLVGKLSSFTKHTYVVDIDLMASTFVPGKANYERVKQALSSNLPLTVDFVLTTGSSMDVKTMEKLLNTTIHECKHAGSEHSDVMVPLLSPQGVECCTPVEFYTWLGTLSNDIPVEMNSSVSYESSFTTPEPYTSVKKITRRKWTGMLHPEWIQLLVDTLTSNALCLPSESGGFTAIHVWGFEDAPVTQGRVEHSYFLHGENLLSLVLTQNQQYHLYKSLATWDFTQ